MIELLKTKMTIVLSVVIAFLLFCILALVVYIKIINTEKDNLNTKLEKANAALVLEKVNNTTLRSINAKQNSDIEKNRIDYENNLKDFENYKKQDFEVKYKELEKYKEVKSNECKDIKNIINSIRSTSF
ncbi:hypothetical protein Q6A90_05055 [Aliarcobacter skirrowii]|uniref:hypothetical protein n=1 Tax=Aliarcobacter skirrowii TaxID=28200 RepID=UPI0029B0F68E|nr:hypothetical protein [Aliarcobacter skirrowii]MDX4061731.1 hypothetical protein [Aliarcobacter skirrowii]